ncbi:uncharacterized protein LOC128229325 [Mya arenaria]|uniref:uncharacterized protein LOC128229325 n=1 Tax=Mya arenaria TaxID=6604 RepID=UPI0022E2B0D2|nr:uncharacterized protein LOC128229325 [Mya arenaria]
MGNYQSQRTAVGHSMYEVPLDSLLTYIDHELNLWRDLVDNVKREKKYDHEGRTCIDDMIRETCRKMIDYENAVSNRKRLYPLLQPRDSEYSTDKLKKEGFYKTLSPEKVKDIVIQKSDEIDELRNEAKKMSDSIHILNEELKQKIKYVDDLRREKSALLQRLSKMAGEKLTRDNPDIADLSDRNRPTKLGEMFNELYDNEWTDAFEELVASGYDEREAVDTLQMTLMKVFQFCEKKASLLVKQTETAADLLFDEFSRSALQETTKNMPAGKKALTMDPKQLAEMRGGLQREGSSMEDLQMQRKWKPKIKPDGKQTYIQTKIQPRTINVEDKLKQMRKGLAESLVPSVQKAYIKTYWDNECLRAIKPFIKRCIFIAWMMVVQTPPMCFDRELQEGATFDAARYRQYTSSGHIVHFLVWPALLLYRDGPVVCKGVAQGKKK